MYFHILRTKQVHAFNERCVIDCIDKVAMGSPSLDLCKLPYIDIAPTLSLLPQLDGDHS